MLGSKNGRGGATRTPRPLRPERSALATALHPEVCLCPAPKRYPRSAQEASGCQLDFVLAKPGKELREELRENDVVPMNHFLGKGMGYTICASRRSGR